MTRSNSLLPTIATVLMVVVAFGSHLGGCKISPRKFISFAENMNISMSWKCGQPKPQLISGESLMMKSDKYKGGKIRPPVIVVHKCDSQLCWCPRGEQCQALNQANVTYEIKIGHKTDYVIEANDISCHCAPKPSSRAI